MKQNILFFFFILILHCKVDSQNLVPDGSLEQDTACPMAQNINYNAFWVNPTTGTPDYFDTCSSSWITSVPNNFMGAQPAFGSAYVGIVTRISGDYEEYIQVRLLDSLTVGVSYCVSYYVSLAGKSAYATNAPQMFFSNASVTSSSSNYLAFAPQISNSTIITDTLNWTHITGTYVAIGGERYITIGNFSSDANTPNSVVNFANGIVAYYYIDNVAIVNCDSSSSINEQSFASSVIIFPNPAKEKATLKFSNPTRQQFTLTLFDSQGRILWVTSGITSEIIEIEKQNFPSGFYFFNLQSDKVVATGKLIIE